MGSQSSVNPQTETKSRARVRAESLLLWRVRLLLTWLMLTPTYKWWFLDMAIRRTVETVCSEPCCWWTPPSTTTL